MGRRGGSAESHQQPQQLIEGALPSLALPGRSPALSATDRGCGVEARNLEDRVLGVIAIPAGTPPPAAVFARQVAEENRLMPVVIVAMPHLRGEGTSIGPPAIGLKRQKGYRAVSLPLVWCRKPGSGGGHNATPSHSPGSTRGRALERVMDLP